MQKAINPPTIYIEKPSVCRYASEESTLNEEDEALRDALGELEASRDAVIEALREAEEQGWNDEVCRLSRLLAEINRQIAIARGQNFDLLNDEDYLGGTGSTQSKMEATIPGESATVSSTPGAITTTEEETPNIPTPGISGTLTTTEEKTPVISAPGDLETSTTSEMSSAEAAAEPLSTGNPVLDLVIPGVIQGWENLVQGVGNLVNKMTGEEAGEMDKADELSQSQENTGDLCRQYRNELNAIRGELTTIESEVSWILQEQTRLAAEVARLSKNLAVSSNQADEIELGINQRGFERYQQELAGRRVRYEKLKGREKQLNNYLNNPKNKCFESKLFGD